MLDAIEISKMQDFQYSKNTFGLGFPILDTKETKIPERYWKFETYNLGGKYVVCSQWWVSKKEEYTKLLTKWIAKIVYRHLKNN